MELNINDLKQLLGTASTGIREDHGKQIVILDRGFVFVGNVVTDGEWVHISNAQNVRRWGTSKGLGQLAKDGPASNTILDPADSVRAPLRALIGMIRCEPQSWKS